MLGRAPWHLHMGPVEAGGEWLGWHLPGQRCWASEGLAPSQLLARVPGGLLGPPVTVLHPGGPWRRHAHCGTSAPGDPRVLWQLALIRFIWTEMDFSARQQPAPGSPVTETLD